MMLGAGVALYISRISNATTLQSCPVLFTLERVPTCREFSMCGNRFVFSQARNKSRSRWSLDGQMMVGTLLRYCQGALSWLQHSLQLKACGRSIKCDRNAQKKLPLLILAGGSVVEC